VSPGSISRSSVGGLILTPEEALFFEVGECGVVVSSGIACVFSFDVETVYGSFSIVGFVGFFVLLGWCVLGCVCGVRSCGGIVVSVIIVIVIVIVIVSVIVIMCVGVSGLYHLRRFNLHSL